ncbi:hypothetical protein ACSBR2_016911 [Camellia fascicularis]
MVDWSFIIVSVYSIVGRGGDNGCSGGNLYFSSLPYRTNLSFCHAGVPSEIWTTAMSDSDETSLDLDSD